MAMSSSDQEIRRLFMDEASDQLQVINTQLLAFENDHRNRDALGEISHW